jgi:hypothetical protein
VREIDPKILEDAWTVDLKSAEPVLEEWGSNCGVRFGKWEEVTEPLYCKCGASAVCVIMGKESYIARCYECMYGK